MIVDATAYYRAKAPDSLTLDCLTPFDNVESVEIFTDDGETLLWSSDQ